MSKRKHIDLELGYAERKQLEFEERIQALKRAREECEESSDEERPAGDLDLDASSEKSSDHDDFETVPELNSESK